jgi:hypothetical protein
VPLAAKRPFVGIDKGRSCPRCGACFREREILRKIGENRVVGLWSNEIIDRWNDLGVHEMDRKVYAVARKPKARQAALFSWQADGHGI